MSLNSRRSFQMELPEFLILALEQQAEDARACAQAPVESARSSNGTWPRCSRCRMWRGWSGASPGSPRRYGRGWKRRRRRCERRNKLPAAREPMTPVRRPALVMGHGDDDDLLLFSHVDDVVGERMETKPAKPPRERVAGHRVCEQQRKSSPEVLLKPAAKSGTLRLEVRDDFLDLSLCRLEESRLHHSVGGRKLSNNSVAETDSI